MSLRTATSSGVQMGKAMFPVLVVRSCVCAEWGDVPSVAGKIDVGVTATAALCGTAPLEFDTAACLGPSRCSRPEAPQPVQLQRELR